MPKQPTLSLVMAHHTDFHGVYFTIQAIRLYFPHLMDSTQFVVVNNSLNESHGQMVQDYLSSISRFQAIKHVPLEFPVGTTPSRNRAIQEADADCVVCMDCHVLPTPGSLESILKYHQDHPDHQDILSGPMLYDDLQNYTTHFDDQWRAEMWGTWGVAWACRCKQTTTTLQPTSDRFIPKQYLFSMREVRGQAVAYSLTMNPDIYKCPVCGDRAPSVPWAGHEHYLKERGYIRLGERRDDPTFEIPGMGLGFFAVNKRTFPGFIPECRGFGGEELCVHELVRQQGGRVLCLPSAAWGHRFGRPDGVKYPLDLWSKVRNYVLWFQKLGRPVDEIHAHFVVTGRIPESSFQKLVADPVGLELEPASSGCNTCGKTPAELEAYQQINLEGAFDLVCHTPRDLDQHLPRLKELASQVSSVTEISTRRESFIAFAAAQPKRLVSYNTEIDSLYQRVQSLALPATEVQSQRIQSRSLTEIAPTDLLFIDTEHNYNSLHRELSMFGPQVSTFIVMHDTDIYNQTGDDNGPGMQQAINEFVAEHPEWSVLEQTKTQYGLTVLQRTNGHPVPVSAPQPVHFELSPEILTELAPFVEKAGSSLIHTTQIPAPDRIGKSWETAVDAINRAAPAGCIILGGFVSGSDLYPVLKAVLPKAQRMITIVGTTSYAIAGPVLPATASQQAARQAGQPHMTFQPPGLLPAIQRFVQDNPGWSVIHSGDTPSGALQGYTVLSCDPADKPARPGLIHMGMNFAKSVATYIGSGLANSSPEEYRLRLSICSTCPKLSAESACSICGCPIVDKAAQQAAYCDLGKWHDPYFRELASVPLELPEEVTVQK